MLRSAHSFLGYSIKAQDGEIGQVEGLYFDDESWKIRYLVVNTGNWLAGRRVLISPVAFVNEFNARIDKIPVILTKEEVRGCPPVDTEKPVSRRKELEILKHYNWSIYWRVRPQGTTRSPHAAPIPPPPQEREKEEAAGTHLRSLKEVTGYTIAAKDGDMGKIEDLIVDDKSWQVRYIAVDTRKWLPGRKVLMVPSWIDRVEWETSRVHVDVTKNKVKESPEYNPDEPVNRDYEERLYDYYGRRKYWE